MWMESGTIPGLYDFCLLKSAWYFVEGLVTFTTVIVINKFAYIPTGFENSKNNC